MGPTSMDALIIVDIAMKFNQLSLKRDICTYRNRKINIIITHPMLTSHFNKKKTFH